MAQEDRDPLKTHPNGEARPEAGDGASADSHGSSQTFFANDDSKEALPAPTLDYAPGRDRRTDAEPDQPDPTLVLPGETLPRAIGEYEILEKVGEGGMGAVYKARHGKLKRVVALKVILAGRHASKSNLERFRAEAEAIARLQDPGIVQIFEIGQHEGLDFLALEFCPGGSLADRIKKEPFTYHDAAALVEALARSMHAAHQQRVIHRDLKPGNVLLDGAGLPRITDFGLAKNLDEDRGLTHDGAVMGTPSYMAPEQARGDGGDMTAATDVYALGAILYELLVGRPPFRAATPFDTIRQVLEVEPVPPGRLDPRLPRDLETICLKCLEKNPARRYGSAQALAEELRRFLNNEPIEARPIGRLARGWRWCKRNRTVASLLAAALLFLVSGAAVSAYFAIEAHRRELEATKLADTILDLNKVEKAARAEADARKKLAEQREQEFRALAAREIKAHAEAEAHAKTAEALVDKLKVLAEAETTARAQAQRREMEANWNLYVSRQFPMVRAWETGDLGQLGRLLRETTPKDGAADFRGWEWFYFQDQARQGSRVLKGLNPHGSLGDWNQKTGLIAIVGRNRTIEIWGVEAREVFRVFKDLDGWVHRLTFSPDGKKLACFLSNNEIVVLDVDTGKKLRTFATQPGSPRALAWAPEGRRLASTGKDGSLTIWDLELGEAVKIIPLDIKDPEVYAPALSWHPDGKRLAAGLRYGRVRVWDVDTGKILFTRHVTQDSEPVYAVAWDHGGKHLAVGGVPNIRVLDDLGALQASFPGHSPFANDLAWSMDDRWLVSGGTDHQIRLWDAQERKEAGVFRFHENPVVCVRVGPTGKRLLSICSNGEVRLSRLGETVPPCQTVKLAPQVIEGVDWSPDGKQIAVAARQKNLLIYDVGLGKVTRELKAVFHHYCRAAWSPDGRFLAALSDGSRTHVWRCSDWELAFSDTRSGWSHESLAWSRCGQFLARGRAEGVVHVLRAEDWTETVRLDQKAAAAVAWRADGKDLALGRLGGSGKSLSFLRADGTHLLDTMPGATIVALAFHPDGRLLACGGTDGDIYIHEPILGGQVAALRGHTGKIGGVAWSPDGRRLASCSFDGTIKIWDAATGADLLTLPCDNVPIHGVTWSPDGKRLAAIGADGQLRLFGNPDLEGPAGPTPAHLKTGPLALSDPEQTRKLLERRRAAVEWTIQRGGMVRLADLSTEFTALKDLPEGVLQPREIRLAKLDLADDELKAFTGVDTLVVLNLGENPLTDGALKHLQGCAKLQHLRLANTKIAGEGFLHLLGLPHLQGIDLWNTPTTHQGLTALAKLPALKNLTIAGGKFRDADLAHLTPCPDLQKLALAGMPLDGACLEHLRNLPNLNTLKLHWLPKFQGTHLKHLRDFPQLRHLELMGGFIGDADLVHLTPLADLETLSLRQARITDAGLKHLRRLLFLKHLDLRATPVSPAAVETLRKAMPLTTIVQ